MAPPPPPPAPLHHPECVTHRNNAERVAAVHHHPTNPTNCINRGQRSEGRASESSEGRASECARQHVFILFYYDYHNDMRDPPHTGGGS